MIPTLNGTGTEHYGGHVRENQANSPIVIIRGSGEMSREATDSFAELLTDTAERATEPNQYVYMDISSKKQGFAPYSMAKINQVLNNLPKDKQFYVCVVISISFIAQLVDIFMRGRRGKFKNLHIRIFGDHAEAKEWLNEQIQSMPESASAPPHET
jgi:hypothetical protein